MSNSLPIPPPSAGRPNPFGGLGAITGVLRAVEKKKNITDYEVNSFLGHRQKNPTDRMRELDSIRMHTPQQEEIELLNISSSRINLLVTQDILFLCGGLVGVRFSSEELMSLIELIKSASSAWLQIGEQFKNMSQASKKYIIENAQSLEAVEPDGPLNGENLLEQAKRFHDVADLYVHEFERLQKLIKSKQSDIARSDKMGKCTGSYNFVLSTLN
jgi:hypothetical protein